MGWAAAAGLMALAGCDLAPEYHIPLVSVPVDYKEAGRWQEAKPADTLPRGAWWTIYGDATLNGLEDRVDGGNPTLAAALAAFQQSSALSQEAEAGL